MREGAWPLYAGPSRRKGEGRGDEGSGSRASKEPVTILCHKNLLLLEISAVHFYSNLSAMNQYLQKSSTLMAIYILQTMVLIFPFYRNWLYPSE